MMQLNDPPSSKNKLHAAEIFLGTFSIISMIGDRLCYRNP